MPILESDSTGLNIAQLIINKLQDLEIPMSNCLALSADNALDSTSTHTSQSGLKRKKSHSQASQKFPKVNNNSFEVLTHEEYILYFYCMISIKHSVFAICDATI